MMVGIYKEIADLLRLLIRDGKGTKSMNGEKDETTKIDEPATTAAPAEPE